MIKEERHKTITVLVSYVDDKPRFLTARDRRYKEWLFITGGCRKREKLNPLRCALRELEEETRGVINISNGYYTYYNFVCDSRSQSEKQQDIKNGLDVTIVYHVYIIDYNVSKVAQSNLVRRFNNERIKTNQKKLWKMPIKRTYDENDILSFDTLEEFKNRKCWSFITKNVIENPHFYAALNSKNKKPFSIVNHG